MAPSLTTTVALALLLLALTHILLSLAASLRFRRIAKKADRLAKTANHSQTHAPHAKTVDDDTANTTPAAPAVPVTILTGFLGSGKTTLVNRILRDACNRRILVIENELGAISVDHDLIDDERQQTAPAGTIVLKNGCICCSGGSAGSELERVLDKIIEAGELEHEGELPFEQVIIETSGLADPRPIVQLLWRREMRSSLFYLDAVITVVDAANVLRHLKPSGPLGLMRHRPEAERQIALADRLLLNKVDLVDDAKLRDVEGELRQLNPLAATLHTRNADVSLDDILDLRAFSSDGALSTGAVVGGHDGGDAVGAVHGAALDCISLRLDRPVSLTRLQAWLQRLAEKRHEDLYRVKGILHLENEACKFIVQGVHAQLHGFLGAKWADGAAPASCLVFIGHKLSHSVLKRDFEECVAVDGEICAAADGPAGRQPWSPARVT